MSRSEVKKEVSAPKWLDKKFLEKCVQTSSNNCHIEVNEFTVEPATKAGDNYGSEMYRVEIVFTELANENEQRPVSDLFSNFEFGNEIKQKFNPADREKDKICYKSRDLR